MSHTERLQRMYELVERDHGGCDDTTCTISAAMNNGYSLVAIECWASSGASCQKFDRLFKTRNKRLFSKEYELERVLFCKEVESVECQNNCGAYIYRSEDCGGWCSNCGKQTKGVSNE